MGPISKLLNLAPSDRYLLLESALVLGTIKLGLWLLPFRTLRRLLARRERSVEVKRIDQRSIKKVVWAIDVISSRVPIFRNCLNRALAAQVLLTRRGQVVNLRIGVTRSEQEGFKAHAWIESEGRIVLGGLNDLSFYRPLPPLEGKGL